MSFSVRPANSSDADIESILRLIKELAIYEKSPESAKATPELLQQNLFPQDGKPYASCLIAESSDDHRAVAIALYFFNFSTWTGKPGLYLEDLFVEESQRGKGIGKAMFSELGKIALSKGCGRVDWSVLDWNKPSVAFYKDVIGAEIMPEWHTCRLEGEEQIKRLENLQ